MDQNEGGVVIDPVAIAESTGPTMDLAERIWLAKQIKKQTGERSKYVPHQGAREKARRMTQEHACSE